MKLAIAVLCYGNRLSGDTMLTLGHDIAWCCREEHGFVLMKVDQHGADRARNRALRDARVAECDMLYMLDADTAADPSGSALEHLVKTMRQHQCVAVSAAVPLRYPAIGRLNVEPFRPFEVYPATKTGAAMLLIDMHRLSALAPERTDWFRFVVAEDGVKLLKSEDVYFVEAVRELGGEVYADATVPSLHLSEVPLELAKMLAAQAH